MFQLLILTQRKIRRKSLSTTSPGMETITNSTYSDSSFVNFLTYQMLLDKYFSWISSLEGSLAHMELKLSQCYTWSRMKEPIQWQEYFQR